MPQFFSQLIFDVDQEIPNKSRFWHDHELSLFSRVLVDDNRILDSLVFKVRKNPKNLLTHLRRIYFCYDRRLSEQLYAALLDFLIVLRGKGEAISRRMIFGCRHQLDTQKLFVLQTTLSNDLEQYANSYCLFTTGVTGKSELVEYRRKTGRQYDTMALANDFIEFSQLEQAMDVLESGIFASPERLDLQNALLQLYQLTGNRERFLSFYRKIVASAILLGEDWRLAANFFEG